MLKEITVSLFLQEICEPGAIRMRVPECQFIFIAFSRYERTHPNFVSAAGIEIFGLQIGRPSTFLQGLWASFLCPLGTKRG